jgi:hypothetical protein
MVWLSGSVVKAIELSGHSGKRRGTGHSPRQIGWVSAHTSIKARVDHVKDQGRTEDLKAA